MQIAELRFGDVGRGISHYRPVVLAVAAIAVMGLTLPGPRRVTKDLFGSSFSSAPSVAAAASESLVPEASSTPEVAAAVEAIDASPSAFSSSFSSPASSSSFSSASPSSFSVDATATRSDASTTETFESSAPPSTTSTFAAPQPLRVRSSAWASAQAGTPVATTGVPAGSLPVGRRPGFSQDKVAFVRLAGTATSLKLMPHADAAGQRAADTAQIQACRITTPDWKSGEAVAMADAPTWDCGVSVLGLRAEDGSWTFDLTVFADRADERGLALVPTGDALDFQVAFALA